MKIALIIIGSIVGIILLYFIGYGIRLLFDIHARKKCSSLVGYTRDFIKESCGFIRIICGAIRIGKTTMGSGIIHVDELNIIDMINDDVNNCHQIMHELNFAEIDDDIKEQYELTHDRFKCFKILSKKYKEKLEGKTYDDYLKVITYYALLESYVYAKFRQFDGNYVMSNVEKYSHITNTKASPLNYDAMKIKEMVQGEDEKTLKTKYTLVRYLSIFEDEKLITDKVSNNKGVEFEDDGVPACLRLLGHLGKEKIYYTTTAQSALRWIKSERELATSIININARAILGDLPTLSRLYRRRKDKCEIRMNRYAWRHFKNDEGGMRNYLLNDNQYKVKHMKYKDKLSKIFSESYLKYSCTIYYRLDDVGKTAKDSPGSVDFDLIFPLTWCFGSLDSHYFSFLQDFLEGYGRSPYYDLKAISDPGFKEAKNILKKKESAKDKKEKEPKEASD